MSIHVSAIGHGRASAKPVFGATRLLRPDQLFRVTLAAGWIGFAVAAFATVEAALAGLLSVLSLVAVDYLHEVGRHSRREALLVGGMWLAISGSLVVALRSAIGLEATSLGLLGVAAYLAAPAVASRATAARRDTQPSSRAPRAGVRGQGNEAGNGPSDRGSASGPSKRPTNFVAAVLHDKAKFDQALDDLVELGIPRDSIGVLYGEAGARAIAHRPRRWFHDLLSDDDQYMARFEAEIKEGGFVVGVPLPTGRQAEREAVRDILWRHGAHAVVSRGRWTFAIDD